jgi:uncharacterized protein
MILIDDRTGLEVLDRDECFRLLGHHGVGRVAVVDAGRPVICPINYVVDREQILFRTAPGTKLDAAARGQQVAFEIDSADPMYHTGWSVIVTGRCEEVVDPDRRAEVDRLPLRPWAAGAKDHVISIRSESVTGRRIVHVAPRED